jgi:hypothetical protein
VLEPGESLLVPPFTRGEIEDVPDRRKRIVDRARLRALGFPLRDEGLQASHVYLSQRQITNDGIQPLEQPRIFPNRPLVLVLLQEPGCRYTKRTIEPHPVDSRVADLIYPPGELLLGFGETVRCSALANASSSEHFVDVPNPTALGET